ncbi:MAG: GFA family protein [Oligoflexales bacterium]
MSLFKGRCHCGEVAFQFETEITSLLECNCTICHKLGSLWIFIPASSVHFEKEKVRMSEYQFGQKKLTHKFCQKCGIETFACGEDKEGNKLMGINVRCLEDFEWKDFEVRAHDGKNL